MSHGHSHGAPAGPTVPVGQTDAVLNLVSQVDERSSQVLNADPKTQLVSILSATPGILRSDADVDPELLFVVNFKEAIKLRAIKFLATEAKSDDDSIECSAPKTVKIFLQRPHASFDECQAETPTELITLTPQQVAEGAEIPVKFAKFQNVNSLTIFVASNQDDTPVTFLNQLSFVGSVVAGTKMNDLKAHEC